MSFLLDLDSHVKTHQSKQKQKANKLVDHKLKSFQENDHRRRMQEESIVMKNAMQWLNEQLH